MPRIKAVTLTKADLNTVEVSLVAQKEVTSAEVTIVEDKEAHDTAIAVQNEALPYMVESRKIETPVPLPLFFKNGGVTEFTGVMECGKTVDQIITVCQLVEEYDFPRDRIFSNIWLDIPGTHFMSNKELKKVIRRAFGKDSKELGMFTRCIFVIGEADSLYSHRESVGNIGNDGSEDFWNLSQAYRFNCHVLIEYHEGLGVLKLLRDKTEIGIEPEYDEYRDEIHEVIYNGHYDVILERTRGNVSSVFPMYKRFAAVV
jgi:hypothetical protein